MSSRRCRTALPWRRCSHGCWSSAVVVTVTVEAMAKPMNIGMIVVQAEGEEEEEGAEEEAQNPALEQH